MRHSLFVGTVVSLGALMAVACGSSSSSNDNGSSGSSGGTSGTTSGGTSGTTSGGTSGTTTSSSGSSGETDGGDGGDGGTAAPVMLKSGQTAYLGTTTDGYVAYLSIGATANSLEVVPVTGGAATVLDAAFDVNADIAAVTGASIAFWSAVDANGIGQLSYWTKATGTKSNIAAASQAGSFWSSADSSRIAFSVGAVAAAGTVAATTSFAVTSAATAAVTPVLTGTDEMNVTASTPTFDAMGNQTADAKCAPTIGFVGKIFVAAYCVGKSMTGTTTTDARLYDVPDASSTGYRLDASVNALGSIKPFFSSDTTGTKLFVLDTGTTSTGRIITVTAGTTANYFPLDNATSDGIMLDDGTAVVYHTTAGAIRRATVAATPVKTDLVASGAAGILFFSIDQKHGIFQAMASTTAGLTDLHSFTTAAASAPFDILTTQTAYPFGITGDGTTALYQTNVDANGLGQLNGVPISGGAAAKVLAASMYDLRILPTGSSVIVLTNPQQDSTTNITTVDLGLLDTATTNPATSLAKAVVATDFEVTGTTGQTLVYATTGTTAGLFALTIP